MYFLINSHWCKKIALVSLSMALLACGGGSGDDAPPGASIEILTGDRNWQITPNNDGDDNCIILPDFYQDESIYVVAEDSQGRGLPDVELTFSLGLSGNTFSGATVVQLFDDLNGNGVPDFPSELVSGNDDSLFTTKTSGDGSKFLIARMNLSCTYRSVLTVLGAGLADSIELSVTEEG